MASSEKGSSGSNDHPLVFLTHEDKLLYAARNGDTDSVKHLLDQHSLGALQLNVNCKGTSKANLGWSPLHLASYFGHIEVATILLLHEADVNIVNQNGDTPLHRAAFTGRTELVALLLKYGSDVTIVNGEGHMARDIAYGEDIIKMLIAIEQAQKLRLEQQLLRAASEGILEDVERLLVGPRPPNINSIDMVGNTALHSASYRDQREVAKLLIQHGANSAIPNKKGHTALDLAQSQQMKQLLHVKSVKFVTKLEGPLLKSSKFTGILKEYWVVLDRGVLTYYSKRADAVAGVKRVGFKYLDHAEFEASAVDPCTFTIQYSSNTVHTWLTINEGSNLTRQGWITALQGHRAYSEYYTTTTYVDDEYDDVSDDFMSLGTLADSLKLRKLELSQALEKSRILQDGLQALAQEHHNLEQLSKFSSHSGSLYDAKTEASNAENPCAEDLSERASLDFADALSDTDSFHSMTDGMQSSLERLQVSDPTPESQRSDKKSKEEKMSEESKTIANGKTDIVIPGCARTQLPAVMIRRDQFSLWTVLKQCIGKELSKITMPVVFNEPLSFLQRFCEYTEHCQLLYKAAMNEDPVERIKYVAAFVMAAGASNLDRLSKPFNPLLGETYELIREDLDIKIVLEQVSHHPPVSAFHCTSPYFEFHGSIYPKLKFWGKSLEVIPKGVVTISIPKYNETYTWHNPSSCLHNLIVGKLWIEMYGLLELTNHKTGHKCFLQFKPAGWFGRDLHKVEGYITDPKDKKIVMLFGKWTEYLYAMSPDGYDGAKKEEKKHRHSHNHSPGSPSEHQSPSESTNPEGEEFNNAQLLWRNTKRPENSSQYYNFTSFAIRLNEMTEHMKSYLPPTDARYRPDIRCMENGDIDCASDEKHRLEEKQRMSRKHRGKSKESSWNPMWFKLDVNPNTGEQDWIFTSKYWDRNYSNSPDIF
ncbi:oxysterol-binding protein-related protein 1-like isoform X3 [Asterias amurensis]|uniref:oxysterol-binding protein-related protein 1-like isoform X3 n=1 Tax=Asterias amurensis TaxID=7602 RepID=UPI003AB5B921